MSCQGCNCGRKVQEAKRIAELKAAKAEAERIETAIKASQLNCEDEYQQWLERAESLGIRLLEEK